MSKTMLINTVEGHECRIALLKDKRLEELYTERKSSASQVGSIYKGRVTNIEPSIQAAFIDFGGVKNGFLHISDVHPRFFPKGKKSTEQVGRRTAHRTRPPIQECLRRGQDVVVQMTKQGIGTKGPTLTTYLSIPGRLIVMMPDMTHVGISRKIEDEESRGKLRKILDQLDVPRDMGVIVRTAGIDRPKRDLQRDLSYLSRLWKAVQDRIAETRAPAEIYQESDLVIRTIRDVFDSDVNRIVCDNEEVAVSVRDFLDVAVPRTKCAIEYYTGRRGLFEEFGVEEEIRKVHSRHVALPNGGSLVFDQAEALVAIDVNSGSFRAHSNAETNALNLNLAAAEEIARQLRLRDMGGVIIIDFVDMRDEKHRRQLEKKVRDLLKKDRAKSKVLRISNFGILEMTRQRLKPSLKQSIFSRCSHCDGTGLVMSQESAALDVMRNLQVACANKDVDKIEVTVAPNVAHHLSNSQRQSLAELERRGGKNIVIFAAADVSENEIQIRCKNARGSNVAWDKPPLKGDLRDETEFQDIRDRLGNSPDAELEEPEEPEEGSEEKTTDETREKSRSHRRGKRGGRRRRKKSETLAEGSPELPPAPVAADPNDVSPELRVEAVIPETPLPAAVRRETSPDYAPLFEKDVQDEIPSGDAEPPREETPSPTVKKPKARRRRKKTAKTDSAKPASNTDTASPEASEARAFSEANPSEESQAEEKKKKSRRRGKRGGRKHKKKSADGETAEKSQTASETPAME
ncbi:MAG: Rne/Rng family ribonuclease [Phycisphaerae bacterium]|nr:Rne/Rng family ribonuclease [Phycisphaerae bacterium]